MNFAGMPDIERLPRKLEAQRASLADLCQLYRASSVLPRLEEALRCHEVRYLGWFVHDVSVAVIASHLIVYTATAGGGAALPRGEAHCFAIAVGAGQSWCVWPCAALRCCAGCTCSGVDVGVLW
jgi:hypothetical protein